MRSTAAAATMAVVLAAVPTVAAEVLRDGLGVLEPWVGTWQIDARWASGETLWAQAEYRPLLGGAFLEGRVYVREGGGELYQRYRTVLAWDDAAGRVAVHSFNHDGSVSLSFLDVDGAVATSSWTMSDTTIDERVEVASDGSSMHWLVWATPRDGERSQIMDGAWRRVDAEPVVLPGGATLAGAAAGLEPLLGGWEISAAWADGTPLWARGEYRPLLAGRFVGATTWTTDADGGWYARYETVFASAADGALDVLSFAFDGSVSRSVATGSLADGLVLQRVPEGPAGLRQRLDLEVDGSLRWQVFTRADAAAGWSTAMDGRWWRQGASDGRRGAIDPGRFVDSGDDLRSFVKEAVIAAPSAEVWAAWTDAATWGRLWGPPSAGRFDLAIGGAYEWLFDGTIGGNGDQVLAYVPGRLLAFSWNAPPSQPVTRLARTWVVVELEPLGGAGTRVRLTHLGFGDGPEWDETFAYFDRAWERVLALMAARLAPEGTSPPGS